MFETECDKILYVTDYLRVRCSIMHNKNLQGAQGYAVKWTKRFFLAARDSISLLCIKSNPEGDESWSLVLAYCTWITIWDYVAWTLVRTGFAVLSVTLLKNPARNGRNVFMVPKCFLSSTPFPKDEVKTKLTSETFCLNEKSTWRMKNKIRTSTPL